MTAPTPAAAKAAPGTQSLQRAIALLRIIAVNNRSGSRLVELYRRTGLERPTVHRLLQGMVAEKLVRQDSASKRYYLGSLAYELGLAAAPKVALRDICLPYLDAIAEHTGDTVFLTVRSGFDGICVARADGSFPIKMFVHDVGRHRPLNVGASGLALMSALPDEEIDRICRINVERTRRKNPRFTEAALRASIESTRRRGYATNKVMDEPPVHSVGMVIRSPDGTPAAGVSVSTLASRLAQNRLEMVVRCLSDAVASIEAELRNQVDRDRVPYAMPTLALVS
ncbi:MULTISPECIES: IclR family transcriptional regulator [Bordetella]|uniref:IclR family transcriptional regulator n=2 Tax=Bordetella TaxID=517 RepID=A0A261VTP3_9BORD|nr:MULTISPECIES: IclR family transcriptional regulator [Bordetella]MDM9561702.1 IclR family transcriptional regulator [Bordetella petrii]OZI76633.1 IclR family transcriptional regulator [Bordetella genomosp. 2]